MRLFKIFNGDRLPAPKHNETKIYGAQITKLSPEFRMPQEYADENKYAASM